MYECMFALLFCALECTSWQQGAFKLISYVYVWDHVCMNMMIWLMISLVDLLTNLLTFLLTYSQTHNLPCMHTYVMIPVIWSGTILLVAFITTTSYCYDQDGWTAMIKAAYKGHKDIVEYLVSQGADKDIKNNVSSTLVHLHLYKMKYMYMYMYVRVNVYMYIYIYMYVCEYPSLLAFFFVFMLLYLCISVCMYKIMVGWLSVCMYVCIMYICLPCCFWILMYIMTTRSLQVDIICVCLKSRMYEHDDLTHDFVDLLTYLLTYILTNIFTNS